jgi:paraquat-inducible protein B
MANNSDSINPPELDQQGINRIRDIVFGPQMRDYEQRFQQVKHDLVRVQQEVERLTEKLIDQDADHLKKMQAMHQDMRRGEENLRGELREAAQRLTDEKVDRTILGELLIELGNNLKSGRSITDMLDLLVKDGGTG